MLREVLDVRCAATRSCLAECPTVGEHIVQAIRSSDHVDLMAGIYRLDRLCKSDSPHIIRWLAFPDATRNEPSNTPDPRNCTCSLRDVDATSLTLHRAFFTVPYNTCNTTAATEVWPRTYTLAYALSLYIQKFFVFKYI